MMTIPLDLLEEEAQALEDALAKYPEGNVGGVPAVFLKYSCKELQLDADGLELVDDNDDALPTNNVDGRRSAGCGLRDMAMAEGKGGSSPGKSAGRNSSAGGGGGRRKYAAAECIEVE